MKITTTHDSAVLGRRLRRTVSPTFAGLRGGAVSSDGSTPSGDSARARILMV